METRPYQISGEIREKLREPFPGEAYQVHSSKSFLTTIKAMYIIERLNDVFGLGRWNLEHEIAKENDGYILMKGQLKLLDYPDIIVPAQYGGHKTGGTGTEMADGYKSAITDCITKSASYLEIGIDVFKGLIKPPKSTDKKPQGFTDLPWLNQKTDEWDMAINELADGKTSINKLKGKYRFTKHNEKELEIQSVKPKQSAKPVTKPELLPEMPEWQKAIEYLQSDKGAKIEDIEKKYFISKENRESLAFDSI